MTTLTPEQLGRYVAAETVANAMHVALKAMNLSAPPDPSRLAAEDAAFLAAHRAELEWWERQAERRKG